MFVHSHISKRKMFLLFVIYLKNLPADFYCKIFITLTKFIPMSFFGKLGTIFVLGDVGTRISLFRAGLFHLIKKAQN